MNEKIVPHSINQCKEPDSVSKTLWHWAGILRSIALVVSIVFVVAGLIGGIAAASSGLEAGGFFGVFISSIVVAAASYLSFFVTALLLEALGNIVYNTHVSANVALYTYKNEAKNTSPSKQSSVAGKGEWKCPKCGNIHQNYVGSCGCGESKPV